MKQMIYLKMTQKTYSILAVVMLLTGCSGTNTVSVSETPAKASETENIKKEPPKSEPKKENLYKGRWKCWGWIHDGAEKGNKDLIDCWLREYNFDIDARNGEGRAPIHIAALNGDIETLKFLIKRGALINSGGSKVGTALHEAAAAGHLKTVEFLLKQDKSLLNQKNRYKETALHVAIVFRKLEVAEFLLKAGADHTIKDKYGNTPLARARDLNTKKIAALLVEYGAG